MDFNGFVRRIDNLGRIVIPKEIRNNLKLKNEDCLEICVENDAIVLRKKNLFKNYYDSLENIINVMSNSFDCNIILTDNDKFLYCCGIFVNSLLDNEINSHVYESIKSRKKVIKENTNFINLHGISYVLYPIIINGDAIGSVIIIRNAYNLKSEDVFCAEIIRDLVIKNLEV